MAHEFLFSVASVFSVLKNQMMAEGETVITGQLADETILDVTLPTIKRVSAVLLWLPIRIKSMSCSVAYARISSAGSP